MRKVVLETWMRDCAVGLHVCFSTESSSTFIFYVCVQWELAVAALQRWTGSSEHSLFAYAATLISACINYKSSAWTVLLEAVECFVCACVLLFLFFTSKVQSPFDHVTTVKTLYNVTRYNRIFNIRHKLLGTDLFPLKFPLYNRIFT